MTATQKERTPDEVQLTGAESETQTKETNMSIIAETTDNRTIRQPIEQVDKTVIDDLLTHIDAVPEDHYWTIDEGDPLYIAPTNVMVVQASLLRNPECSIGDDHYWADIYDMDGRRLPLSERPDGWHEKQQEIRNPGPMQSVLNAAHRLGDDYVVVGRGRWIVTAETTLDGKRAYELVTTDEYMARSRETREREHRAFLDANPIIEASMPWWAKDINIEQGDALGEAIVTYGYAIGVDDLFLYQEATFKGGLLTLGKVIFNNGRQTVTLDNYAAFAEQLHGFADAVDRIAKEVR